MLSLYFKDVGLHCVVLRGYPDNEYRGKVYGCPQTMANRED